MAFALFYNAADLQALVGLVGDVRLSQPDRQFVSRVWQSGLKDWAIAQKTIANGVHAARADNDGDCRIIVIDNAQLTLQQLRDFLYRQADALQVPFLRLLANDMGGTAVEPWNG